ncbi:MAG: DNA methylase [Thermodesulfobacteriota bacterium]
MIERAFDIPFVADLALREKQIQQNYRPIIAVHKWFARRPGTLFRALLLSEFSKMPLREAFYRPNKINGLRIADPFMGGGTPLIEANRLGCDVIGYDINPMSYWIVKQEIEHLDLGTYQEASKKLRSELETRIGHLYQTRCLKCGSEKAHVKYFLWVKVQTCHKCGKGFDLFPGFLLSENRRHPKNVFVCSFCGELTETFDRKSPGNCGSCGNRLSLQGPASRSHCSCPHCHADNKFPDAQNGPPRHRMFAIEYYCPSCKETHKGRFFKKPDVNDLSIYEEAHSIWEKMRPRFVPEEEIPSGDETDRLHRWGYKNYHELFNSRQLLGLESSCRIISHQSDRRVRNALATNLSDLLRYQNMLCRYDSMALKSLDIFSVHGFPVGLVQCESNLLGVPNGSRGLNVGSGGWSNIIDKFLKAKSYCERPFEILHKGSLKVQVAIEGEWIGDIRNGRLSKDKRDVNLKCENAAEAKLTPASLDAVFTDPPYYGNVQYAELMDFCYVWLRRLVGDTDRVFQKISTRDPNELTGNKNMGRGLDHFTEGISGVFQRMAKALKPGSPLAFTYHHNNLEAYFPIAVAILDSGLTCSASLPCPAEMGASIHIKGTGSSIIDTVLVCRSTGAIPRRWITDSPQEIATLVAEDTQKLSAANIEPTQGDIRCVIFGHLIRLTIWFLRNGWDRTLPPQERLTKAAEWSHRIGGLEAVQKYLPDALLKAPSIQTRMIREFGIPYGEIDAKISF